jgi:FkbM family methyltransferase
MRITGQNHHDDLRNMLESEALRGIPLSGLVHIGAHEGEEVEQYFAHGFERLVLIEANPDWCGVLTRKFSGDERIRIFNYAVCDRAGSVDLHIHTSRSGSTEPASILGLKRFKEIVKTLHTPRTVSVPAITLDGLFEVHGIPRSDYNFINIDIQGAELLAFRGASKVLEGIDVIISEVNVIEMYDGAPSESEIAQFLAVHGFRKEDAAYHALYDETSSFPAWGECLFVKRAMSGQRR